MANTPRRLLEDPKAPEALRTALSAAEQAVGDAARLAALKAKLGDLPEPSPTTPSASAGSGAGAGALKLGALSLLLGIGAYFALGITPEQASPPTVSPAAMPSPATAPPSTSDQPQHPPDAPLPTPPAVDDPGPHREPHVATPMPAPKPAPRVAKPSPQARKPAPPADPPADPRAELALIQRASRSLSLSPRRTLELLAEHQRTYPTGVFAEEREMLRVDALRAAGRMDEAKRAARNFLRRFPKSAQTLRLRTFLKESTTGDHKNAAGEPPTSTTKEVRP